MTDPTKDLNNAAQPDSPEVYEQDARACDFTLLHRAGLSAEERDELIAHLKNDALHNAEGAIPHAAMALAMAKDLTSSQKRELISVIEAGVEKHPKTTFYSARDVLHYAAYKLERSEIAMLSLIRSKAFHACKDCGGNPPSFTLN